MPAVAPTEGPAPDAPADTPAADTPAAEVPAAEAGSAAAVARPPVTPAPSAPQPGSASGAPRPGPPRPAPPRPGPPPAAARPAARPTAVAAPVEAEAVPVAQPSPVTAASTDPSRWGRVDEEGTVYLRTADGERVVGSWQAGAPVEGLAHFARRFDDVLTEVELLVARLGAGGGDPKQTLTAARGLRTGLDEASIVGDVPGLAARLDELIGHGRTGRRRGAHGP